jgi:hypothetical protein
MNLQSIVQTEPQHSGRVCSYFEIQCSWQLLALNRGGMLEILDLNLFHHLAHYMADQLIISTQ